MRQDFNVRSAKLRIRILAPDGKTPVPSLELYVSTEDRAEWQQRTVTDREGQVVLDVVPLGMLSVRTWPKHLATPVAREEMSKKDATADMGKLLLEVGTVEVTVENEETKRELTLPPGSSY